MERCPTCGGKTFGEANCVICAEPFIKIRTEQITCGSLECRKARQLKTQKEWMNRMRASGKGGQRFPGEYVICLICGDEVEKVRVNQATCLKPSCIVRHRDSSNFRGLKAKHVYRNLGTV